MQTIKILCCISLIVLSLRASAQKNLLENGGFEDNLDGWNDNGGKITPWDFKSGKASCAIIAATADKWMGIDQAIRIPKKATSLEISAWLKALNVVKGKNDWDGALFGIAFLDAGDKEISGGDNIARLTGDQSWTFYTKVVKIPEKAVSFKILIAMGNASGTLIVDDVAAKAVVEQPAVK